MQVDWTLWSKGGWTKCLPTYPRRGDCFMHRASPILSRPICGTLMRVAKIQNGSSNNAGTRPLEQNSEIMFLFFWPWFLHASPFSFLLPLLLLSETFDFLQTFPPPTTTLSQPKTPQIPLRRTSSCVYKLIDRRESWGSFFRSCKVSGGSGHRYFLHE